MLQKDQAAAIRSRAIEQFMDDHFLDEDKIADWLWDTEEAEDARTDQDGGEVPHKVESVSEWCEENASVVVHEIIKARKRK
jgi:hypothetical protein